ncbi:MAG: HNH endonuclease family protein, partial [Nitrospiraceae bacterium]
IEHVMPQTIDEEDENGKAWVDALGQAWRKVQGAWLHTPGNLTLVGYPYNIEMQNRPFEDKKSVLSESKVYLNRHFADPGLATWDETHIKERGERLAEVAARVWMGPL